MPYGLKRFQQSAQSHFVTFTCYHRQPGFSSPAARDLFIEILERMRCRFALCIYGYVVMPEHVHLLVSEPRQGLLADAMHYLKLSFAKRLGWWPRFAPRFWALTWDQLGIKNVLSPPPVACRSRSRAVHSDSISTIPVSRSA